MKCILALLTMALVPAFADAAPKKRAAKTAPKVVGSAPAPVVPTAPPPLETPTAPPPVAMPSAFAATDKLKVVVMDLRASNDVPADFVASLSSLMAGELEQMGPFAATAAQDVLQMVTFESMRQSLGCEAGASCLAELGGALGADYMVTGNLSVVSGAYLLQLQLMDLRASTIVARTARDYSGQASGLLDEVRVATRILVRDILARRSGRLVVAVVEEGASVTVDGAMVGVTPLREPLSMGAGTHNVAIDKRGFVRFAKDVTITEGVDTRLDVVLRPSDEFRRDYRDQARFTRRLAWTGVVTGGVALAVGGGLFAKGANDASSLRDDVAAYNASALRDSGTAAALAERDASIGRLDTLAVVSLGVGVAALATGIVLFLTGDDPDRYETRTSVTPTVMLDGRGGAAVALTGHF